MNKLDERHKKILRAIIQSHIDLNTPVGSVLITKRFPIGLSPATVRNTMAKLEKLGYITQPHTSAGRIPTEKGYNFYVEMLLDDSSLNLTPTVSKELSDRIELIERNSMPLREAAETLSHFSHYLAIVTPPSIESTVFQHIKFLKYARKKVLAVMVTESGTINNKSIELGEAFTQNELDRAAHYINSRFSGLSIKKVREKIAYQLYREKVICDELIESLIDFYRDITSVADSLPLNSLSGTSNLPDFVSMAQIKDILRAIEDKQFILKLLHQVSNSDGTRVLVGMEKIMPAMRELSMVISTYNSNSDASGAVGIIGPTRMNYKKLIPAVDHTAKALTRILSKQ